jgi:hypothetical protein
MTAAEHAVAVVIIHRAAEMTPRGREKVAEWLCAQAVTLLRDSASLGPRYRARYMYAPKHYRRSATHRTGDRP